MANTLTTRLLGLRGLITVPGTMALAIWSLAPVLLEIDQRYPDFSAKKPFAAFFTHYDTATATLATISSAAISTLALVYSLVLVVFTLAAGTIAPRLLKRFTNDRVNQITAGLFGGTFLYALTVLHQTNPSFVPTISISAAFALAAMSVLQLIFFVHSVSRSVAIDEEIAAISEQLEKRVAGIVRTNEKEKPNRQDLPAATDLSVTSRASGYISFLADDELTHLASSHALFIDMKVRHGEFVVAGQAIAEIAGDFELEKKSEIQDAVRGSVTLSPARGSVEDIEFALSILLEIALRALSPGLNDTFTAIACVDRYGSAHRPCPQGSS